MQNRGAHPVAARWSIGHSLAGKDLAEIARAGFTWQEGREYAPRSVRRCLGRAQLLRTMGGMSGRTIAYWDLSSPRRGPGSVAFANCMAVAPHLPLIPPTSTSQSCWASSAAAMSSAASVLTECSASPADGHVETNAMLLARLLPRDDDLPVAFVHARVELHGGEIHARPEPAPAATAGPEPTAAAPVVATATAATTG